MDYLIRILTKTGKRNMSQSVKAHYWLDGDTLCKMASTGGLKVDRFRVFDRPMGKDICHMCSVVHEHHESGRQKNWKVN